MQIPLFGKPYLCFFVAIWLSYASYAKQQIAFCVDFSASTSGILPQLQRSIWSLVNMHHQKNESIDLALVSYGRKAYENTEYKSKIIGDFNTPIFDMSYQIFKSTEYIAGTDAIHDLALLSCLKELSWDKNTESKKIILIANGPLQKKYLQKVKEQLDKKSISLHLIYYNPKNNLSELEQWKKTAKYLNIPMHELKAAQQNNIVFKKNYDEAYLFDMGEQLLNTYLPYGREGERMKKKIQYLIDKSLELDQDIYEACLEFLASSYYQGSFKNWDLVDLYKSELDWKSYVDIKFLPNFMQAFNSAQIQKYIELRVQKRQVVIDKIRIDSERRTAFLKKQLIKSVSFQSNPNLEILLLQLLMK